MVQYVNVCMDKTYKWPGVAGVFGPPARGAQVPARVRCRVLCRIYIYSRARGVVRVVDCVRNSITQKKSTHEIHYHYA